VNPLDHERAENHAERAQHHQVAPRNEISDQAFHRIQEELDWSELDAAPTASFQSVAS
jgi:monovalent cation/hydrogen antiporter